MKDHYKNNTFSTRGPLGVMILSLSIIFLAVVSSYVRYRQTIRAYRGVNHITLTLRAISELKNVLMEKGNGTFLITGNKTFKPDLEKGYQNSMAQLQFVDSLIANDTQQRKRLDSIKILIENRYTIMAGLVKEKEGGQDSLLYNDVIKGRILMNELTGRINAMSQAEVEHLNDRIESAEKGGRASPVFLIIASAISFFFIVVTYSMLARAYKRSLQLQNLLEQNVKELNRSNSELEQFAYVASHDLQEPLRKLRTFGNMIQLKEKDRLSPEGNELLERMQFFGARMQRLIEDLLTFSRMINKEKETFPVDLNRLIADVKNTMLDINRNKEILIQWVSLPVVSGYEFQLIQLFQNLISNSIKYSKTGEKIRIDITSKIISGNLIPNVLDRDRNAVFYKISVIDNGIGFENEYSEKIFNIFQRLHGKSEYEGTGIGLAICKRVVENHNGYINASSQPGQGTIINVYLHKV